MEILVDHGDIVCVASGRVVLARWEGRITIDAIDATEEAIHRFYERAREPLAEIVIVKAGVPLPDKATRTRLAAFMRRMERRFSAVALAYEGTGARAMTIRAAASGIVALSNAVIPSMIVATAEDAIPWLLRYQRITPENAEQLKKDLATLRASRG